MGIHCFSTGHKNQIPQSAWTLPPWSEIFTIGSCELHSSSHSHHVQLTAATAPVLLPPLPPLRGGVGVHPDARRAVRKSQQPNAFDLWFRNSQKYQKLAKDGWNKWITNNLTGWFGGPMYNIRIPNYNQASKVGRECDFNKIQVFHPCWLARSCNTTYVFWLYKIVQRQATLESNVTKTYFFISFL